MSKPQDSSDPGVDGGVRTDGGSPTAAVAARVPPPTDAGPDIQPDAAPDAPPAALTPSRLFLISKTDGEFVVWDAAAHKVGWIPADGVSSAEIVQVRDLFEVVPAPSQGGDP